MLVSARVRGSWSGKRKMKAGGGKGIMMDRVWSAMAMHKIASMRARAGAVLCEGRVDKRGIWSNSRIKTLHVRMRVGMHSW